MRLSYGDSPRHLFLRAVLVAAALGWSLRAQQGATALPELIPGPASPFTNCPLLQPLWNLGPTVLFSAEDGLAGCELWKTDGTVVGTMLVKDIRPGPLPSNIGIFSFSDPEFAIAGDVSVFGADDGVSGYELWRTDGTPGGTVLLKDIRSGLQPSKPAGFAVVGGMVFFTANDGITGSELWKTDGTLGGTVLVKDIFPGFGGSGPVYLTPHDGRVFFRAWGPGTGNELWVSDGTEAGTVLVKDVWAGSSHSNPRRLGVGAGHLWFTATRNGSTEVWKSDGTTAGTVWVKTFPTSPTSEPSGYSGLGSAVFFSADDGVHGNELWTSDGTTAGTMLFADIGGTGGGAGFPGGFVEVGGGLVFSVSVPFSGSQLYFTDGTVGGTRELGNINPDPGGGSAPIHLTKVGNRFVYFLANGGSALGSEVWRTDGTDAGTVLVADVHPSGSSLPRNFVLSGGEVIFTADDGTTGRELWKVFPGATAQDVGDSCAGAGQHPRLSATDPVFGSTWTISGSGFTPGTAMWLLASPQVPPRRMGPCTLWLDPSALGVLRSDRVSTGWMAGAATGNDGSSPAATHRGRGSDPGTFGMGGQILTGADWSVSIPLPNLPSMMGRSIVLQALVAPAETAIGVGLTNGVVATFGN